LRIFVASVSSDPLIEVFMKKRVLLVEDHPDPIDVMRLELEVLGYDVTVAKS
jgi:CheY-like chemotaxis protein